MNDYTVLIPCRNEGASIRWVVSATRQALPNAPILVIDDDSDDDTGAQARRAGAACVRTPSSNGKGAAMRFGLAHVETSGVLLMDGDGQDDPRDLLRLLAAHAAGADLVVGSRFIGTLEPGSINLLNHGGNLLLTRVFNQVWGTRLTDTQAGMRCLDARLARELVKRSAEYEVETEMLARAVKRGCRIVEVPVTRHPRSGGQTDFKRIRNGLRILWTIMRERAA